MKESILWCLFLLLGTLILAAVAVVLWSQYSGTSISRMVDVVFTPQRTKKQAVAKVTLPLDLGVSVIIDQAFNADPVTAQLQCDAHQNALQTWCQSKGHTYDRVTNQCLASSQRDCELAPAEGTKIKYDTRFINGQCVSSLADNLDMCSKPTFGGLPPIPPDVTCVPGKGCTAKSNPSCLITAGYCRDKGVEFDSNVTNGDCVVSFQQEVVEAIFGKTIIRTYKKTIRDALEACKTNGPLDPGCLKIVDVSQYVQDLAVDIVWRSIAKGYSDDVTNFKSLCLNGAIRGPSDALACVQSAASFFPEFWLKEKGAAMLNGVLGSLGFPTMDSDSLLLIVNFPPYGLNIIFMLGTSWSPTILEIGTPAVDCIAALFQGNFNDCSNNAKAFAKATSDEVVRMTTGLFNMAKAGAIACYAMLRCIGEGIYHAALLIQQAFVQGGKSLAVFISDTLLKGGFDGLKKIAQQLGIWFGEAGVAFVNAMKEISNVLADIASSIEKAVSVAAKDVFCFGLC
jgi:hypothetical protein